MLHLPISVPPPLTNPIDSGKFWVLRYSVCLRFAKSGIRTNSPKFPKSDNLTGQFPAHGGNIPGGAAVSFMYCNCNEPLFPLSPSLSRRVHWSREEGGDGGLSMLGVRTPLPAWCPTPLAGTCGHHISCLRENIERRCEDKCLPIVLKSLFQLFTCLRANIVS